MTVAKNADVADVQEALVAELVQRELQAASKLAGLFTDYSDLVGKGTSTLKIPRASSFTVASRDNVTPAPANAANLTFSFDEIALNQSKYVYYVIPGDVELDAKPSYELTAASRAATAHGRNMDIARIDTLWTGAESALDVDFVSGTSDIEDTILEMIRVADEQEMLDDGNRFVIIRPEQRKQLLGVANFVQADRYGDRTPLVSGELGQVYGVRFVVVNHAGSVAAVAGGMFGDGKMILCHKESLGFAFHRMPTHDMDKAIEYGAGSMAHTWDVKYGLIALQEGGLIIRAWNITP
jgi:N4-gp56 family major capsid protein